MSHSKTWIAHAAAGTLLLAGAVAASAAKRREDTGTATSGRGAYSDDIDDDWFYDDNCQIQFASPFPCKAEQLYDDAWTSGLFDF